MRAIGNNDIEGLRENITKLRKSYIKLYKDWKRFSFITLIIVMISLIVSPFKEDMYMSMTAIAAFIILIIMFVKVSKLGKVVKDLYIIYKIDIDEYNYYDTVNKMLSCIKSARHSGDSELRDLYNSIKGVVDEEHNNGRL